jgi:hypothetical protein
LKISNQRSAIHNLLWLAIPSLLVIAALWFDWLPWLRGNVEWQWPLRTPVDLTRAIVPLIALAGYVALAAWWLRAFDRATVSRKKERIFRLFLTVAAPLIQLALAFGVSRAPLLEFFGPTVSAHNSGYFTTAVATSDLNQLLAHYPSIMPALPIHAQSHPPGPVIAHWLSWQAFQSIGPVADAVAPPLRALQCHNPGIMALDNAQIASASLGMLLPLIGALAVWPLFAFGKRVVGSKAAALGAVLFPIMPLLAMWPAQWDQIYPLLLLSGLYFAHIGLERKSVWRLFVAGVPLSIASFFSVGNFVLMGIVGLYGVTRWWIYRSPETSLRHSVSLSLRLVVAFVFGCASIWIIYTLIYGVNPFDVIATGSRLAFESTTGNRTYGAWLVGNPIDFAVFVGVPVIVALAAGLVGGLRHRLKSTANHSKSAEADSFNALLVAVLGTLIALILSGIVRGEVGRLWMYFGPLIGLNAAYLIIRHLSLITRYSSLVLVLLALQLFVMNARWLVNDSFLDAPPDRSVVFTTPVMSNRVDDSFANQIALRGYDMSTGVNQIDLTLYWRALSQPPHAYTIFAHVFDANGQSVGQQDNMPVRDQLPTSCWQPGEYVSDPYAIKLLDGARGPFTIEVGVYRLETGDRLPLDNGAGTSVRLQAP